MKKMFVNLIIPEANREIGNSFKKENQGDFGRDYSN